MSDSEHFDSQLNLSATSLRVIKRLKSSSKDGEAEPPAFVSSIVGEATLEKETVLKHSSRAQTSVLSVSIEEESLDEIRDVREIVDQKYGDYGVGQKMALAFSDLHRNASRMYLHFIEPEYSDVGKLWDLSWNATILVPPETLRALEAAVLDGLTDCSFSFYCEGLEYEEPRTFSYGETPVLMMTADLLPGYLTGLSLATPDEAEALGSGSLSQAPKIYQNKWDLLVMLVGGLTIWSVVIWGFNKLFG